VHEQVFISYSHDDGKYMKELLKHLKPFVRSGSVTAWSDQQIASPPNLPPSQPPPAQGVGTGIDISADIKRLTGGNREPLGTG
jgi:hypothetical protein